MCAPEGNSEFCFPSSVNVFLDECFVIQQGMKNNTCTIIVIVYHDNKSKI